MIAPRYTVRWAPEVEAGVAVRWTEADSAERDRLTKISYLIDEGLSVTPERKGEPLDADARIRTWDIFDVEPPVRVTFEISPDDCFVDVLYLTLYGRSY